MDQRKTEDGPARSPVTLLKEAVNVHGELHLDKERTAALVRWVEKQEEHMNELGKQMVELLEALKPIIGPLFIDLKGYLK